MTQSDKHPPLAVARLPRNAAIDLLRGLSILLVVVHHIALRIPLRDGGLETLLPRSLLNAFVYNGYEAVFLFFVISGFLITSNALDRWGSLATIDVRAFYVRRSTRILPCLVLLMLVLSALHLFGVPFLTIKGEGQSLSRALLAVFTLHLNWYEGMTGYLPGNWDVLWSLSIEEVFYLGFPLLCLLLRKQSALLLLLALLALSLPITRAALAGNEIWQEKAYLPGMAAIATGVIAALLAHQMREPGMRTRRALCVLGVVGIACNLLFGSLLWKLLGNGLMLVLTLSAGILLVALHRETSNAPRGTHWLASMGRLSYEIYLTHMFIVFGVVAIYSKVDADPWFGFLWYAPVVVLCWLLGAALAHGWSIPCDRALRARWLRRSKVPVATL
ncbi:MAG TPA: acyltransferase [Dokdonella sp.]|uniref:acyltransferase family protein n=1 Tax=Dokdonella sp. TaxID=2291710 RepID=UPI002D7EDB4D|nr:acyltransferase [Dokdonella sp.]HET9033160.1 acyltransferase [Dokdonella sp.]